jgi:pyridoxamine 5'-phosphate oxidase
MRDLHALRRDYASRSLDVGDVDADPLVQFERWFHEAREALEGEPNAMTLATATSRGVPSARVVLLKGLDERGFVFYTNRESRKGHELDDNPHAALVFLWEPLERQVRIEGTVERVSDDESDAYFATRPLASRVGAWASRQSEVLPDRDTLERAFAEATERLGAAPPRPPHWGGYRVVPERVEFWQGRRNRLHDRMCYRREGTRWCLERLAP